MIQEEVRVEFRSMIILLLQGVVEMRTVTGAAETFVFWTWVG
jgi:hypothetical protein